MREVVLDTETTGLSPVEGHRIVEIGCLELRNKMPTGARFHRYVNPEREIPEEVSRIHGLTNEDLANKERFGEIADELVKFLGEENRIVIHNAEFDLPFLNDELARAGFSEIPESRVFDTLALAREKYPGQSNSLDALCRRFRINTARRKERHGALVDAALLAEVYIDLTDSRVPSLELEEPVRASARIGDAKPRPQELPPLSTPEERARHAEMLEGLGEQPIWRLYLTGEGDPAR